MNALCTARTAALVLGLAGSTMACAQAPDGQFREETRATPALTSSAAATPAPTPTASAEPPSSTAPALPADHPVTDAMLNAVAHDLHNELGEISKGVDHLASTGDDKWFAAKMAFLGVLAGAGVTGLFGIILQSWRLRAEKKADERRAARETRKAERDFGLEAMANLQAFRTRQLNEFYGPFRVLLSQIRVLRDEFDNRLLASWKADDGADLKFDGDGRERRLVVRRKGVPARGFRLIDEMAFVKINYPDLMSTIGEMVSTGDLLVDHLHKNGGLLDPRSTWLGAHVAVYLAHERVLKEIFERAQRNADATWVANYSTVYPRHLDLLIERDYKRLYRSQARWSAKTARWAEGAD